MESWLLGERPKTLIYRLGWRTKCQERDLISSKWALWTNMPPEPQTGSNTVPSFGSSTWAMSETSETWVKIRHRHEPFDPQTACEAVVRAHRCPALDIPILAVHHVNIPVNDLEFVREYLQKFKELFHRQPGLMDDRVKSATLDWVVVRDDNSTLSNIMLQNNMRTILTFLYKTSMI